MARFLSTFLGFTALSLGALSAPIPEAAKKDVLYIPTKVGDKSVYQQGEKEWVLVVTTVEKTDGSSVVCVTRTDADDYPADKVAVSEKGVFRLALGSLEFDKPVCMLSLPHKEGNKWEVELQSGKLDLGGKSVSEASGPEKVELPAGVYMAIRVETDWTPAKGQKGGVMRSTVWHAPRVGVIKWKVGHDEVVLKSFTPGKD